jgi:hypothetical protein
MNLKKLELRRLTVHKIYGKSKTLSQPYAGDCSDFCKLGSDGDETLHKRISSSLDHRSKFFELDLENSSSDSFFHIHKPLWGSTPKNFLEISQNIADKAAAAHEKSNIPDGLLMILEALIDGYNTIITVKAEKSNAFSMAGNNLQLIKDIFLSSDKTLYKLGFFIKHDKKNASQKSYKYYVYDDAFAPSKDDLAFYFYNKFLGLSTDANSKLQTNRLHKTLQGFATDHINLRDRMSVLRNIDHAFMDSSRKNLNAFDFKSFFPNELFQLFESTIETEFPLAVIKDNSIVSGLKTKRISISANTTLLLKSNPEGLMIGNTGVKEDKTRLKTILDSGNNYSYVVIPTGFSNDQPFEQESILMD